MKIDYEELLRQISGSNQVAAPIPVVYTYVQYNYNDIIKKMNDKLSGKTSDDQFFQELEKIGNQSIVLPKEKKPKKIKKNKVKKKEEELDINGMASGLIYLLEKEKDQVAQDLNSVTPQVMQVLNLMTAESQNTKLLENMNTTLNDISFRQFKELVNKSKG